MSYRLLSLNESNLWYEYFHRLSIEQQDVYFTPEYYSLYEKNGDGVAYCFVYEEDDDFVLYPFLKNSINSLGYDLDDEYYDIQGAYGYNGFVTSSKKKEFLSNFFIQFRCWCVKNNIVAGFTRFHPILKNYDLIQNNAMKVIFDRKTVASEVGLSDEEYWKKEISTQNRNTIKKAIKNGLTFYADYDFNYMSQFVALYKATMDKLSAESYYYFSDEYFSNFVDSFKGKAFLGIVFNSNKEVISAAIFFVSGIIGHYHLSGSNHEYLFLNPNNLLLFGAARHMSSLGVKYLHLGGGTTSSEVDNLFRFKVRFGSVINDFYIGKEIYRPDIYSQILDQWKEKYPDSYEKNKVKLLGYREI